MTLVAHVLHAARICANLSHIYSNICSIVGFKGAFLQPKSWKKEDIVATDHNSHQDQFLLIKERERLAQGTAIFLLAPLNTANLVLNLCFQE